MRSTKYNRQLVVNLESELCFCLTVPSPYFPDPSLPFCFSAGRKEILDWLNGYLGLNISKVSPSPQPLFGSPFFCQALWDLIVLDFCILPCEPLWCFKGKPCLYDGTYVRRLRHRPHAEVRVAEVRGCETSYLVCDMSVS